MDSAGYHSCRQELIRGLVEIRGDGDSDLARTETWRGVEKLRYRSWFTQRSHPHLTLSALSLCFKGTKNTKCLLFGCQINTVEECLPALLFHEFFLRFSRGNLGEGYGEGKSHKLQHHTSEQRSWIRVLRDLQKYLSRGEKERIWFRYSHSQKIHYDSLSENVVFYKHKSVCTQWPQLHEICVHMDKGRRKWAKEWR